MVAGTVVAGLMSVGLLPVGLAAAAGGPNLALGKAVSASGSLGGYGAPGVTDGNQGSYWEGPSGAFPTWVQVDLGSSVAVDQVVLKLPAPWETRTETLTVQGSTDGNTFTTLSASAGRVFNPAQSNAVTIGFTAATVRYVRVSVTANTGWQAAQISELEVYSADGSGDPGDPGDPGTPPPSA